MENKYKNRIQSSKEAFFHILWLQQEQDFSALVSVVGLYNILVLINYIL